jgi:hypothetical protein
MKRYGRSDRGMTRLPVTPANCPRCGGRLARDNDSGRCAACQAAERDRLIAPPTVPASFWEHEPIRQALTERHLGRVIRAYRCHPYHGRHPLPQTTVARWLGITQAQLSRVENGPPLVHLDRLIHWAQLLHVPGEHLWFKFADQPSRGGTTSTVDGALTSRCHNLDQPLTYLTDIAEVVHGQTSVSTVEAAPDGGGTTDRRSFTTLAALVGIAVGTPFDRLVAPANAPQSIGMEHVLLATSLVDEFRRADSAVGADGLCDVAIQVHAHLSAWAAAASYSRAVGDALQNALAALANQAAWLAIDAERRPEARPYLNEAMSRARIADDPREEVRALACLSLLIRDNQPGESLQCAEAALRVAAGWATPRLITLLHLRAAHAYAAQRDMTGFNRAMTKARREFDLGTHEDDQAFVHFVTAQEISGIQGLSYLALGKPDRAANSLRSVLVNPSTSHRRNQVMYTVSLADAMSRQNDVNGAARTALAVLPTAATMDSTRVRRILTGVRHDLARPEGATALTREFVGACDRAIAR